MKQCIAGSFDVLRLHQAQLLCDSNKYPSHNCTEHNFVCEPSESPSQDCTEHNFVCKSSKDLLTIAQSTTLFVNPAKALFRIAQSTTSFYESSKNPWTHIFHVSVSENRRFHRSCDQVDSRLLQNGDRWGLQSGLGTETRVAHIYAGEYYYLPCGQTNSTICCIDHRWYHSSKWYWASNQHSPNQQPTASLDLCRDYRTSWCSSRIQVRGKENTQGLPQTRHLKSSFHRQAQDIQVGHRWKKGVHSIVWMDTTVLEKIRASIIRSSKIISLRQKGLSQNGPPSHEWSRWS